MFKYWNIILIVILFTAIVIWSLRSDKETRRINDNSLQTNIAFTGQISSIKVSKNHNLGIVFVNLDKSTKNDFYMQMLNRKFAYRTKNDKGEIYTIIPDGIAVGDKVKVVSDLKTVYYFDISGSNIAEEYIFTITNPSDIEFINNNTNFR